MRNATVLTVEDEREALATRRKRGMEAVDRALVTLVTLTQRATDIRMKILMTESSASADYYAREARDLAQRLKDLAS